MREDLIVLGAGCVCCSVRNDLMSALFDLHVKASRGQIPRYSRVILETTGLADPTPIVGTLAKYGLLRSYFHLAAVVTAVDTCLGARTLATQPESVKQAALADRILLTKTDLAPASALTNLDALLASINPLAPRTRTERGIAPPAALLDRATDYASPADSALVVSRGRDEHQHQHEHEGTAHGVDVRSFSETIEVPIEYEAFAMWLSLMTQMQGEHLLRFKGILRVRGDSSPVVIQSVQHVVYPVRSLSCWPYQPACSKIVVITRASIKSDCRPFGAAFERLWVLPSQPAVSDDGHHPRRLSRREPFYFPSGFTTSRSSLGLSSVGLSVALVAKRAQSQPTKRTGPINAIACI